MGTLRRSTTSAEKRRCESSGTDKLGTENIGRYATELSKWQRLNGEDMDTSAADDHERMAEDSRGAWGSSSSSIVPAKPI